MWIRSFGLALTLAGAAQAQDPDVLAGADLFATYCWQCHGPGGEGDGPMAATLAVEVPDLTTLTSRFEGEFPLEEIARQIDGRNPILAHGGEMPVFGPMLQADQHIALRLPTGQPMMTGLPLANLITYIESIQE